MTLRVLMTTAILFTAASTAEAERHCRATLTTQEMIFGKLRTLEQPYCLGKPIRHPKGPGYRYPSWAQFQEALRVQELEGEGS